MSNGRKQVNSLVERANEEKLGLQTLKDYLGIIEATLELTRLFVVKISVNKALILIFEDRAFLLRSLGKYFSVISEYGERYDVSYRFDGRTLYFVPQEG